MLAVRKSYRIPEDNGRPRSLLHRWRNSLFLSFGTVNNTTYLQYEICRKLIFNCCIKTRRSTSLPRCLSASTSTPPSCMKPGPWRGTGASCWGLQKQIRVDNIAYVYMHTYVCKHNTMLYVSAHTINADPEPTAIYEF